MQRQILFRAKRVDNGEWVEGSLCNRHDSFGSLSTIEVCTNSDVFIYEQFQVIPETVGQLVETIAFNQQKVFDGDIVKYDSEDGIVTAKIVWKEYDDESSIMSGYELEVISV